MKSEYLKTGTTRRQIKEKTANRENGRWKRFEAARLIQNACECLDEQSEYHDILASCLRELNNSPTARLMIKEAIREGWSLSIADLEGYDFHLDVPDKKIILDGAGLTPLSLDRSSYFRSGLQIAMVRALRDAWQEKRHGGFEESYGLDAILMLERVRAADSDVMAVLVAWELRGAGQNNLWRHLIGSEEGDLALAFSSRLERDPSSLFTGLALCSAFDQWFKNRDRVTASDHETLNYIDDIVFEGNRAFGMRELTPVGIEVLSCMPDKTAYLRGCGRDIMSNPLYAGLCDPVNQAHYMQITHDLGATYVQGVPFRDSDLAEKIFPGGEFTDITDQYQEI